MNLKGSVVLYQVGDVKIETFDAADQKAT